MNKLRQPWTSRWCWGALALLLFAAAFASCGEGAAPSRPDLGGALWPTRDVQRTPLDSSLCASEALIDPDEASRRAAPADAVDAWLARYSPRTGTRLRLYMPGEFNWWSHRLTQSGMPAAYALAQSIHETLHHAGRALNLCDGARWHYVRDGHITTLAPGVHGQSPYAQAASFVHNEALRQGLRYQRYMANGGLSEHNNFYVLLDELNAYIAEADFLLSVLEDPEQALALQRKGLRTDAGFGGAVEFQLFALAYLAMQCSDPSAGSCKALEQDEPLLAFMRTSVAQVEALIQRRERLPPQCRALMLMPPGVEQERQRPIWGQLKRRFGL